MEINASCPTPKRGDLMQSNRGTPRERTWLVLRSVRMKSQKRRYAIFRARWWELEVEMRMRLYRSAERNGGQAVWHIFPLPRAPKKKQSVNFGM